MTKLWNVARSPATQCSRKSDSPDTIQASRTIGLDHACTGFANVATSDIMNTSGKMNTLRLSTL